MESTITRPGCDSPSRSRIVSTSVSASSKMPWPLMPMRSARSLICTGDSSPVTYRTWSIPELLDDRKLANCSSRVDLPTPGSPVSSDTEPGTMPPPRTRFNSADGSAILGWELVDTSASASGSLLACPTQDARLDLASPAAGATALSVRGRVESQWGLGQNPIHLALSCPHSWQM